jgi:predicted lipid-binding transport protein (Tim44 family)
MYTSPYPPSKGEVVRLQLTLPVLSFVIFMGLPAGKKLFVITTLIFSIVLTIVKLIRRKFLEYKDRKVAEELAADSNQEQLVVQ